jgi:hypothetical protein
VTGHVEWIYDNDFRVTSETVQGSAPIDFIYGDPAACEPRRFWTGAVARRGGNKLLRVKSVVGGRGQHGVDKQSRSVEVGAS